MAVENDLIERHGDPESREERISLERREWEPPYKLQITENAKIIMRLHLYWTGQWTLNSSETQS